MSFHAATAALILTLFASPVFAQSWPARVQEIVDALAAGVPHSAPDEVRREVTKRIAEQVRHELGPNWGWKRADPGRPLSTDVFATQFPFVGYDWSVPSGVAQFPTAIDLTGQVFVPVEPVNHLGLATRPPPDVVNPPVDLSRLEDKIDRAIEIALRAEQKLDAYAAVETARWQEMKGIWEGTMKPVFTFAGKYLTGPGLAAIITYFLSRGDPEPAR